MMNIKDRMHGIPKPPVQEWTFHFDVCGVKRTIKLELHKAVSQPTALIKAQEKLADMIKRNPETFLSCAKYTHRGAKPLAPGE